MTRAAPGKKPRAARTRPRKRRGGRRGWWIGAGVVLGVVVALGVAVGIAVQRWRSEGNAAPSTGPRRALVWPADVAPGSDQERALLGGFGVDADGALPRSYRATLVREPISPGPHWIPTDVGATRVLDYLTRGGRRPTHRVVIPEGFDRFEVAERLEAASICEGRAFLADTRDGSLLTELQIGADSAEGYLFPDSYDFYENTSSKDVVRLLVRTARKRIDALARAEALAARLAEPDWVRGIVIMASLVEKEARHAAERAVIAGVFENRLRDPAFQPAKMLQTDPSAAYGCKLYGATLPSCVGFAGRVTPLMLRDSGNPYNTYRHAGLPPGPIANPGEGALRAAMKPSTTPYYFFVARGDGSHAFSRTLSEHERATARGN